MSATTTLPAPTTSGLPVLRRRRAASLVAVGAFTLAALGLAAAVDPSSSLAVNCTAPGAAHASVTGPLSVVPVGAGGEIVLSEQRSANRYAVFCGSAVSNIEWIKNG
jgi:hypothetical protein